MKKRFLIVALAILSLFLVSCGARKNRELYTYNKVDGGYEISGIKESREELEIPKKYKGKRVIGIGDRAFFGDEKIKSVTLPEGIEYLGVKAFKNCYKLESINMPSTLKEIKEDALYNCDRLIYEEYEGCYYIGNWLMEIKDKSLQVLNIREGTVGICSFACYESPQIRKINFPDSVRYIGSHAFFHIPFLRSLELGPNVEMIGQFAFANCSLMKKVTIPPNVVRIDNYAFHNCKCEITVQGKEAPKAFEEGWNGACVVIYEQQAED